jgi:CTP-dependent riboflavin kinase
VPYKYTINISIQLAIVPYKYTINISIQSAIVPYKYTIIRHQPISHT